MPNKEAIRAWAEDLRSTDAPQGRKVLRSEEGDCCLMRACLVYQRETGKGEPDGGLGFVDGAGMYSDTALPMDVQRWYGLDSSNPELLYRGRRVTCQNANDTLGLTFKTIADGLAAMYGV